MAKATYEEKISTYWQNIAKDNEPKQQINRNVELAYTFRNYTEFQAHQKRKGLEKRLD